MKRVVIVAGSVLAVVSGCATQEPAPESLPQPAPAPVVTPPVIQDRFPSILFETGAVTLSPAQRQQVREMASVLKERNVATLQVVVEGHTDAAGSADFNQRVSVQRAEAVARELVFNGIAPERITVIGRGETAPLAPNFTPEGEADPEARGRNRRVDVRFKSQPVDD